MRKLSNRPTRKLSRQTGATRRALASCGDPHDSWDPFEILVIWIAASRAMEKLRENAAPAALASKAIGKTKPAPSKRSRQPQPASDG